MPIFEAITLSLLGISVVFSGLLLIVVFIKVFGRIAQKVIRDGNPANEKIPLSPSAVATTPVISAEPIPPDIQAVIAAAIEVERRLYLFRSGARLTIRRSPVTS